MNYAFIIKCFLYIILICSLLLFYTHPELWAQCPMCKAAAESNLKEGGTAGVGLNAGIMYLFCIPYLLVGTIGFLWWWNNRKVEKEQLALQQE